jgi:hypothetical protein
MATLIKFGTILVFLVYRVYDLVRGRVLGREGQYSYPTQI